MFAFAAGPFSRFSSGPTPTGSIRAREIKAVKILQSSDSVKAWSSLIAFGSLIAAMLFFFKYVENCYLLFNKCLDSIVYFLDASSLLYRRVCPSICPSMSNLGKPPKMVNPAGLDQPGKLLDWIMFCSISDASYQWGFLMW